jgi:hypothetical protein
MLHTRFQACAFSHWPPPIKVCKTHKKKWVTKAKRYYIISPLFQKYLWTRSERYFGLVNTCFVMASVVISPFRLCLFLSSKCWFHIAPYTPGRTLSNVYDMQASLIALTGSDINQSSVGAFNRKFQVQFF